MKHLKILSTDPLRVNAKLISFFLAGAALVSFSLYSTKTSSADSPPPPDPPPSNTNDYTMISSYVDEEDCVNSAHTITQTFSDSTGFSSTQTVSFDGSGNVTSATVTYP